MKGTNPILQCEVAGTGPFEISWYKDKKQIRSSKKYRLTSQKAVISLEVSSFNSADVGEYECVIANEVGKCMCSATYILKGQWERENSIYLEGLAKTSYFIKCLLFGLVGGWGDWGQKISSLKILCIS